MYMSFKDALLETAVEAILKREFKHPFKINETSKEIQLIIFVIPYKERQNGKATEFINRVIELGKMKNKNVVLTISDGYLTSKDDMSLEQLAKWYKKLGFVKNKNNAKFSHIYYINK